MSKQSLLNKYWVLKQLTQFVEVPEHVRHLGLQARQLESPKYVEGGQSFTHFPLNSKYPLTQLSQEVANPVQLAQGDKQAKHSLFTATVPTGQVFLHELANK